MSDTASVTLADTRIVLYLNILMGSYVVDQLLGGRTRSNNASLVNFNVVDPSN